MPEIVRLTQIDGSLPNLALARIGAWHRARGDEVHYTRSVNPGLFEPRYDRVYGSVLFDFSKEKLDRFRSNFPEAVVGGTGSGSETVVESLLPNATHSDLTFWPDFDASIGYTQRGCRLKCKFCLTEDNEILTADGPKRIVDVEVGDMVLTHKGRYRRVTEVMSRPYKGPVHTLKSNALSDISATTVTPEHPMFMRHRSYRSGGAKLTDFRWIDAGDVRHGRHRTHSQDVHAYPRLKEEKHPGMCPGADWLPMTKELASVVGWYLSDGYVGSAKGRDRYSLTVYIGKGHKAERDADQVVSLFSNIGIRSAVARPKDGQLRVVMYGVAICRWMVDQFGSLAHGKKVPLWFRLLPMEYLEAFLRAYAAGNGTVDEHHGKERIRTSSTSWPLTLAIREIALKCGYTGTVNRHKASDVIQGRKVAVRDAYTVIATVPKARKISTRFDEDYVYTRAADVVIKEHDGLVYNIEVDEDHSYCTPAFAVHNCVVPKKEGRNVSVGTLHDLWRGNGRPKHIHLLDNDFFGQPWWRERIEEARNGGFKLCFSQGINVRLIDAEVAEALASIDFYDTKFAKRRLYVAWDNLKDEGVFFRGVDFLERAGIAPTKLMAYMLIGFDRKETWERIFYRFQKMVDRGIDPYPMPFDQKSIPHKRFQRWVVTRAYRNIPFDRYNASAKGALGVETGQFDLGF